MEILRCVLATSVENGLNKMTRFCPMRGDFTLFSWLSVVCKSTKWSSQCWQIAFRPLASSCEWRQLIHKKRHFLIPIKKTTKKQIISAAIRLFSRKSTELVRIGTTVAHSLFTNDLVDSMRILPSNDKFIDVIQRNYHLLNQVASRDWND